MTFLSQEINAVSRPVVKYLMLDTGYCLASEHHIIRGGERRTVICHSLVALLHHEIHGWLLWDTGYAPRMLTETTRFPFSLYRKATPLFIAPELAVVEQLKRWNITARDIGTIIISHFHADHIAGLRDFPEARFLASSTAYQHIQRRHGLSALRKAFIPALLPDSFDQRLELITTFADAPLPGLGPTYDLFGDGSLRLVPLPGHARGQMGLFAETVSGPVLLAADGSWLRRSIRECLFPSRLTMLFVDNFRKTCETIARLHAFSRARPDVKILPTHCPEVFEEEVERQV